jgi:intracellular sulfur oxidation DsrE/DsrF family protein
MAHRFAALTAVLLCIGWPSAGGADHVRDGRSVHRMVFQMNEDNSKLRNLLLNNIGNIINQMGKDRVEIKVVAYGPGIDMFRKDRSTVLDRLESLKKFAGKGVEYTVCSNTMKAMKVERQDIVEFVDDFYPGIVRIIELEEQGYVYLRP